MFVKEPLYRTNFHLYKRKKEHTLSVLKKLISLLAKGERNNKILTIKKLSAKSRCFFRDE